MVSPQRLSLDHNRLSGAIPRKIGALMSVEALRLDANRLTGSSAATPNTNCTTDIGIEPCGLSRALQNKRTSGRGIA